MRALLWSLVISASGLPALAQDVSQRDRDQILVATVFGKPFYLEQVTPAAAKIKREKLPQAEFEDWLRKHRGALAYRKVWEAARRKYVEGERLTATKDELAAIAESVKRQLKSVAEPKYAITPEQRKGMVVWQRASLIDWKVCRSLYAKYGGRVGTGSMGSWSAFDGQNLLLREHLKAGDIKFHHACIEKEFWQHTTIKNFADAYPTGERLRWLLATPPYMLDQTRQAPPDKKCEPSDNRAVNRSTQSRGN